MRHGEAGDDLHHGPKAGGPQQEGNEKGDVVVADKNVPCPGEHVLPDQHAPGRWRLRQLQLGRFPVQQHLAQIIPPQQQAHLKSLRIDFQKQCVVVKQPSFWSVTTPAQADPDAVVFRLRFFVLKSTGTPVGLPDRHMPTQIVQQRIQDFSEIGRAHV